MFFLSIENSYLRNYFRTYCLFFFFFFTHTFIYIALKTFLYWFYLFSDWDFQSHPFLSTFFSCCTGKTWFWTFSAALAWTDFLRQYMTAAEKVMTTSSCRPAYWNTLLSSQVRVSWRRYQNTIVYTQRFWQCFYEPSKKKRWSEPPLTFHSLLRSFRKERILYTSQKYPQGYPWLGNRMLNEE